MDEAFKPMIPLYLLIVIGNAAIRAPRAGLSLPQVLPADESYGQEHGNLGAGRANDAGWC